MQRMPTKKTAVIIGAGPAGLTAAYELLKRSNIKPLVLEKSTYMGGISRTINYKGNRIDIGGHRFFSKSDKVMNWWRNILPIEKTADDEQTITYQQQIKKLNLKDKNSEKKETVHADADKVMLLRERKSRIYFLRKFFAYPIKLTADTLIKLGFFRTGKIGFSYLKALLFPIKNEKNLEEFFINRFGKQLYLTFFKSYTEKVWGVACNEISADWGAQRIKGLSVKKAISDFIGKSVNKIFGKKSDIFQKNLETSLIEQFLYPKFGPGQMWEEVARQVKEMGGEIISNEEVIKLSVKNEGKFKKITAVSTGTKTYYGDYFFSTMPVKELIAALDTAVPADVKAISDGLIYRDFITVGLLLKDMRVKDDTREGKKLIKDNWIYIQEPDVRLGRLQIFNNWSPYMVADPDTVWVGLEYFCFAGDDLWNMSDKDFAAFAIAELEKIGIIEKSAVIDSTVIKMEKTYPAYFGTYGQFPEIIKYISQYENLFLVGRNGMHKYNNQDHSMLTAMTAVDNIIKENKNKENIWQVNTEQEYHEKRKTP